MNYAIAYLAGIFLCSTIYWYVSGKKFYKGPLVEATIEIEGEDKTSSPPESGGNGLYEAPMDNHRKAELQA